MPRYIDADKVMEEINRIGGHNLCEWETLGVRALIDRQPTADVAPRAEVDELIYKLECLLCHATGGKLSKYTYDLKTMETVVTDYINESYSEGVEDGYKDGAAEVAMEIFEEIEKTVNACVVDESLFKPAYFEFRKFNEQLAELKNRYTDAETEPPEGV
jgi:hypothetical protein